MGHPNPECPVHDTDEVLIGCPCNEWVFERLDRDNDLIDGYDNNVAEPRAGLWTPDSPCPHETVYKDDDVWKCRDCGSFVERAEGPRRDSPHGIGAREASSTDNPQPVDAGAAEGGF